jgi:hypothetical protein
MDQSRIEKMANVPTHPRTKPTKIAAKSTTSVNAVFDGACSGYTSPSSTHTPTITQSCPACSLEREGRF